MYKVLKVTGWPLVWVLTLAPVWRWATMVPIESRFANKTLWLLSLGQITALSGLVLFSLSLLLATRSGFLEDLFGGQNKVYMAHHKIGALSFVLLMVHPMMVAMMYTQLGLKKAAEMLLPLPSNIPVSLGVLSLWILIGLLVVTLYVKLPYGLWLKTHKLLGVSFVLGGAHALIVKNQLVHDRFIRWYIITTVAIGVVSWIYRTISARWLIRQYSYMVHKTILKAPGDMEVTLVPDNQLMNFRAGQFVFLSFLADGISHEWHPFSISSAPGSGELKITIKALGDYTNRLVAALPGMTGSHVLVEGAYGRFSYTYLKNPQQIWVGGGIGITPFLSMARDMGAGPYNIDLYYSVAHANEFIDLEALQATQINTRDRVLRIIPFVADKEGFLTAKRITEITPGAVGREILICGPPVMMKALREQFRAVGVPNHAIHTEEFSMS